jgi:hypothetical protein
VGLAGPAAVPGPNYRPWRADGKVANQVNDILVMGLVAIAVVIVMAGLLGRLVDRDDLSTTIES